MVLRGTLIIIPTDTPGIRTFTIIRMPGMRIHIIRLPQLIGPPGIGLTTITGTIITRASKAHGTL